MIKTINTFMSDCGNHPTFQTKREFLTDFGWGVGGLTLATMFGINPHTAEAASPLAPKNPHFPVKAKSVIQLFASGAPSHVDTFDYKPELQKRDGMKDGYGSLLASPFNFPQFGKSGLHISEVWSKLGQHADDMAIINSMQTEIPDHGIAQKYMNTGSTQLPKPSLGSWLTYGLGTLNQNMPAFITLNGSPEWRQCAFLPGMFQGCNVQYKNNMKPEEILSNLRSEFSTLDRQRRQIELAKAMNIEHMARLQKDAQLESRIEAFETAFKMQTEATDAFDISKENEATHNLYGNTEEGNKMLVARRLVERGVRFVQVHVGGYDHHSDIKTAMTNTAARYDTAFSGLLTDLKQRGLLDSTLVIWGGEFGRTVTSGGGVGAPGRDHNGKAFSVWMAGGGVQGGQRYGETDETGGKSVKDVVAIHDLHATILALMGFDHKKLTYNYNGREFRLTDNFGNVIKEVIA
jgi:Protein of unknown function (DUF1501)